MSWHLFKTKKSKIDPDNNSDLDIDVSLLSRFTSRFTPNSFQCFLADVVAMNNLNNKMSLHLIIHVNHGNHGGHFIQG
jgi:hypothetical protein